MTVIKNKIQRPLKEVAIGECFVLAKIGDNNVCIKTAESDDYNSCCVRLTDGEFLRYKSETDVIAVNAKVVVD